MDTYIISPQNPLQNAALYDPLHYHSLSLMIALESLPLAVLSSVMAVANCTNFLPSNERCHISTERASGLP